MPSTVEQLSPSRVKLTVEIPFADLKPHLEKAYSEIAKQVTIPGFRKGKVPHLVIDQRFGRGMVIQEAIEHAWPSALEAAVTEANVVPLGQPEVEVTRLEDGDVVELTAEVDVRPEFTVPAFSTLSATVEPQRAVDEEVDERIAMLRQRFATTTEVDRPAAEGDQVTISLVGKRDGETLQDATADDVTYVIGTGGMIDGLDEAVTGLSAGDTAEFASTLVGGPLEGEPADITVTVGKVSEQKLPEVDDDFAQLISEFDTVEEMRADLTKAVEQMAASEQVSNGRDKVLEALVDATDFEVPERVLEAEVAARKEQITDQLQRAGLTLERYLEQAEEEEADTAEEFWAGIETSTERSLRAQLILDKVADDAEVGVEQSDLSELLLRKAAQNGTSPEQEAQHMMEHNHVAAWMQEIRRNKALGLIVAEATVTDTDGNVIDLAPAAPVTEAVEAE
ncbi:trigger factor [Propionicimonas sp.]|uniref:trigger factor n=1 Tax=Propionicimonas sp. TaxID=1955623 RepID=UPI0039E71E07